MYSDRFRHAMRDLDDLTLRQRRFLGRIAFRIPQLIKAIVEGAIESRWGLGKRQLDDGRQLELELVVRAPKREPASTLTKWGSGCAGCPEDNNEVLVDTAQKRSAKR